MKRVIYYTNPENHVLNVPCIKDETVKVGSISCQECEHLIGIDKEELYVECSYEDKKYVNFLEAFEWMKKGNKAQREQIIYPIYITRSNHFAYKVGNQELNYNISVIDIEDEWILLPRGKTVNELIREVTKIAQTKAIREDLEKIIDKYSE